MKKCSFTVLVALAAIFVFFAGPVLGADIELAKKDILNQVQNMRRPNHA